MEADELAKILWDELRRLNIENPVYRRMASTPAPVAMLVDEKIVCDAVKAALNRLVEPDVREAQQILRSVAKNLEATSAKIQTIASNAAMDIDEQTSEW